jgi:hypothetical protein
MQNYSRITREPGCFERQQLSGQPSVNPAVAPVGKGPILRIGENQKAPTIQRPPNRTSNDAIFIVLQERDDFCVVRVVPIGKLFEKCGWGPGQCSTAECPLLSDQRKTLAQFEFFRFLTLAV